MQSILMSYRPLLNQPTVPSHHRPTRALCHNSSLLLTALVTAALGSSALAEDWPGWRRDGSGVSHEDRLPDSWSATDNVRWKTAIPGEGISSPIIWKDKVFVTTALAGTMRHSTYYASAVILWLLTLAGLWSCIGIIKSELSREAPSSPQGAERDVGYIARRPILVIVFGVTAYLVLIACEELRKAYPTEGFRVLGVPWTFRVKEDDDRYYPAPTSALRFWEEQKPAADGMDVGHTYNHVPTDCFIAGFSAALLVLALASLLNTRRRESPLPPSRYAISGTGILAWLQCFLILAIGGKLLQLPGSEYLPQGCLKFFVVGFAGTSVVQFLLDRPSARSMTLPVISPPCPRPRSWLQSWFTLGMAGTFFSAVHTYFLADVPFQDSAEYTTWFATANICSLGIIAALGCIDPSSPGRAVGCGIAILVLTVLTLQGFRAQPVAEWWLKLRAGEFHTFGALALVSTAWFFLEFLRLRRQRTLAPGWPSYAAPLIILLTALILVLSTTYFLPKATVLRQVICIDRKSGTILWRTTCAIAEPSIIHRFNSLATPTPVTDGECVYAHFGGVGAYCLDFEGHVLWSYQDPVAPPPYGAGSSPVLCQGLLLLTYDGDNRSLTVALDKTTGQVQWEVDRTQALGLGLAGLGCYSTPAVVCHRGKRQLVNHSCGYLCGYELPSGRELWHWRSPGRNIIATPVLWNDVLIIGGGERTGKCLVAVTLEEQESILKPREVWRAERHLPETSSPVVYGPYVYTITRGGIASCLEASSGKLVWMKRLRGQYDAAITAGDGKIYFCNTDGTTAVIAAGDQFRLLASNCLDEPVRASPAISEGNVFIRGERHIYCTGGCQ